MVRVRDAAYVSKAEWEGLRRLADGGAPGHAADLQAALIGVLGPLFHAVARPLANNYRLFDGEVIELNAGVALLVLAPPQSDFLQSTEGAAAATLTAPDAPSLVLVPEREFAHTLWRAHQPALFAAHARLALALDAREARCRHDFRSAMSADETAAAKAALAAAAALRARHHEAWAALQWLPPLIQWARKGDNPGISVEVL